MPKYTFNFNLEAWVAGVEIEADSYEEALDELHKKTAEELLEEGYIKESDISSIDCDVEDNDEDYEDDWEETSLEDVYAYIVEHDRSNGELTDSQLHELAQEMWEVIHREEMLSGESYDSVEEADLGEIIDSSDAGSIARTYGYKWFGLDDDDDDSFYNDEDDE